MMNRPRLGIFTLGAANRHSIEGALQRAGAATSFVSEPSTIGSYDALVLPGVANFGYIAHELDCKGLRDPLLDRVRAGVPLLGICAGYQLLFDSSEEAPQARGLGIFHGAVRRLRTPRAPHMGWNSVTPRHDDRTIRPGWAYFANSYAPSDDVPNAIGTTCEGNESFASAARKGAVWGVQFHPERSGAYGASLLERFVRQAGSYAS